LSRGLVGVIPERGIGRSMQEIIGLVVRALLEIVVSVLLQLPGLLIVYGFGRKDDVQVEGCLVLAVSLAFWGLVAGGIWAIFW